MDIEYTAAVRGRSLPKAVRSWSRSARELGCETRGPVMVADRVWAHARPSGSVEIWNREPTADETRAAIYGTRARGSEPALETPTSAASQRVVRLFERRAGIRSRETSQLASKR